MNLKGLPERAFRRLADMFDVPYDKSYKAKMDDLEGISPGDAELVSLSEVLYECIQDEDTWVCQVTNPRALTRSDNNIEAVKFYINSAADDMGRGLDWLGALAKIWAVHAATGYAQAIDELHRRCCQEVEE